MSTAAGNADSTSRPQLAAIVLAAGVSRRMGQPVLPKSAMPLTDDDDGVSFLERHVAIMRECGVDPVHVVVSQATSDLFPHIDGMNTIVNPFDTATTGSTLSLLCALRSPDVDPHAGLLVTDADIVYERELMRWIVAHCDASRVFVSPNHAGDDEEVTVYGADDSQPCLLGKGLPAELIDGMRVLGESLGIVYVAPRDRELVRSAAQWLAGWPPERGYGFSKELSEHEEIWQYGFTLGRVSTAIVPDDLLCSECDTPADYEFIRSDLFPRIVARDAETSRVSG